VPAVCHVREAEEQHGRAAGVLVAPVRLARAGGRQLGRDGGLARAARPTLGGRVRVVYNGFAFTERRPSAPAERSGPDAAGRPSPAQRPQGAGRRQRRGRAAVAEGLDVELQLVGDVFRGYDGTSGSSSRRPARLGIADRVVFAGFAPSPAAAYAAADVVLVPSRLEPFGNVAVEALALGRPVVASAVGGLPEVVDDGVTGCSWRRTTSRRWPTRADPGQRPPPGCGHGRTGAERVRERFGSGRNAEALRRSSARRPAEPALRFGRWSR
jgi:hypothetical protein